jgi:hypothetical protein
MRRASGRGFERAGGGARLVVADAGRGGAPAGRRTPLVAVRLGAERQQHVDRRRVRLGALRLQQGARQRVQEQQLTVGRQLEQLAAVTPEQQNGLSG